MSTPEIVSLTLGAMLLLLGLDILLRYFRLRGRVSAIRRTGHVPVAKAAQGLTEIQGHAWPSQPIGSPLEGFPCAYLSVRILQKQGTGWVELAHEVSGEPFFVVDESGYAVVLPEGAELDLRSSEIELQRAPTAQKERLLAVIHRTTPTFKYDESLLTPVILKVEQAAIPAGAPLYVLGDFQRVKSPEHPEPARGLPGFLERARRLRHGGASSRAILDANRNGRICSDEWFAGYAKSASAALAEGARPPSAVPLQGGFSSTRTCPLFLADAHEEELLARMSGGFHSAFAWAILLLGCAGGVVAWKGPF